MRQLVDPVIPYRVDFGQCLKQVRSAFGAPVRGPSATSEANRTAHRHYGRDMPDVAVPVWFDHWGTYGWPARYDNWGHVVVWVPGRGFLSSPKRGTHSFHWYGSIEAIERAIGAKYRFWSEDINGVRVVGPKPKPKPSSPSVTPTTGTEYWEEPMKAIYYMNGKTYIVAVFHPVSGFWSEYNTGDSKYNNRVAKTMGTGNFTLVTKSHFEAMKRDLAALRNTK